MNLFDSVDRWLLAAVLRMPKVRSRARALRGPGGLARDAPVAEPGDQQPADRLRGGPVHEAAPACARVCTLEPGDGVDRVGAHE